MGDENNKVISMSESELKEFTAQVVRDTLISLGVDHSDPLEMQKDFQHLREFRESTEAMKRKGVVTLVGIFVASVVGAIMMALKEYFR